MASRSSRCGLVLRRLERAGGPAVLEDPVCGRRAGHAGQHLSEAAMRRRRYARRVPSGSDDVGAAIRSARRGAGMSQRRLAAALGVTVTAVRHWEHAGRTPGDRSWVQLELTLGPLGIVRGAGPEPAAGEGRDVAA